MNPRKGDIVRYIYLDADGKEVYGLVIDGDRRTSDLLILYGQTRFPTFSNDLLRVVA
jgi:hypothetical protein